jgi:hypothetical protein
MPFPSKTGNDRWHLYKTFNKRLRRYPLQPKNAPSGAAVGVFRVLSKVISCFVFSCFVRYERSI